MEDIITKIQNITNENEQLKKINKQLQEENEKLKSSINNVSNEECIKLQSELKEMNNKISEYETKIKELTSQYDKSVIEKYISLIQSLKIKINLLKNDYNKISLLGDILYEYYNILKIICPNIKELITKYNMINHNYLYKYKISQEIKFIDNVTLENDTTLDPIYKSQVFKPTDDIILEQLTKDSKLTCYEDELIKQLQDKK